MLRNRKRLSSSFRNYILLRSKLDKRFFRPGGTLVYRKGGQLP